MINKQNGAIVIVSLGLAIVSFLSTASLYFLGDSLSSLISLVVGTGFVLFAALISGEDLK